MGMLTRRFEKPGKGVEKNEPEKRSFFKFFDIFFRKFWDFFKINIIFIAISLPVFVILYFVSGFVSNLFIGGMGLDINEVGAGNVVLADILFRLFLTFSFSILCGTGPATAGLYTILWNYSKERHAWVWSDFKDGMKDNLKQSIIVCIIDILTSFLIVVALLVYRRSDGMMSIMFYPMLWIAIMYFMMHLYIYPLMINYNISVMNIYRNALFFSLGKLPSTLGVLIILFAILFLPVYIGVRLYLIAIPIGLLLLFFIGFSFCGFIVNMNAEKKFRKYLKSDDSDTSN